MKTDGGWVTVSECARLYGRSRKWVYDQISAYGIGTQKQGNRTRLRLVDLIAHQGEPSPIGALTHSVSHTKNSQKITPPLTPKNSKESVGVSVGTADSISENTTRGRQPSAATDEKALLKQENEFLRGRIEELEADRAERRAREAGWQEERTRLQGIIERQTVALPKPEPRGVFARLRGTWGFKRAL